MAQRINRADVAAAFHAQMCEDPSFGYTQASGRWGDATRPTYWDYGGVRGFFYVGDRDCSSSVIDCWQEALRGSEYENALLGASFTGNMRQVFVDSGLFDWHPMGDGYIAQRGDVYLNEEDHTAMCQSAVPDMLSEFLIAEDGTIIGKQVGDQTGMESVIRAYYWPSFGWDGILAYNGKADTIIEPDDGRRGVHTHAPNQTAAQRWEFIPTGNPDEYRIKSKACGKYLMLNPDVPRDGGFAVCVGDQTCEWELTQLRVAQPLDKPVNLTCGARYLDAVGGAFGKTGIQAVSTPSTGYSAKWYLVWAGEPSTYYIHACGSDLCLDVDNAGRR